jgi:site-specific DNA recombinase
LASLVAADAFAGQCSHLAPEILGALLAGRHPIELTPTRLLRLSKNLPHNWKEQRRFLG